MLQSDFAVLVVDFLLRKRQSNSVQHIERTPKTTRKTYKQAVQLPIRCKAIRHHKAGFVIRTFDATHRPVGRLAFRVADKQLETVFGTYDPHIAGQIFKVSTW